LNLHTSIQGLGVLAMGNLADTSGDLIPVGQGARGSIWQ
jgi:hypothetical protein